MFQHRPAPSIFNKDVYAGVCGLCRNQAACGGCESENEKRYGSKPGNFSKKDDSIDATLTAALQRSSVDI